MFINRLNSVCSKMVTSKKIVLHKRFDGLPKLTDFKIVEENLAPIKDGEFLAEAVYLSVDPYMRAYAHNIPLGTTMVGTQIAKVVESKNEKYPVESHVVAKFDWTSHSISAGKAYDVPGAGNAPAPYIVESFEGLPISYALGILGMPGSTAYFGFLENCKPQKGETVVISGAAGAVGSIVGQIAKIKGCKVIGITGSDEKGKYLIENLGFDNFVNYKSQNLDEKFQQVAPEGIDCYFDNVAGEISSRVIKHMNQNGRISACGSISSYNYDVNDPPKATVVQPYFAKKELEMNGFQNYLYNNRFHEAKNQISTWLKEKKIKYQETITEGFDNMPKAFIEMLQGKNLGKAIVKV